METNEKKDKEMSRRTFFKVLGTAGVVSAGLVACGDKQKKVLSEMAAEIPTDKMTYRMNPSTGDKVSLLGFGMMRLPSVAGGSAKEGKEEIDQELVNRMVDFAIAHGVNYFDTSPAYCRGESERATGIALSRYPRDKYFIATKLSNFAPVTWSREASIAMYKNSFKELQVDYIDYLLLHAVGMGGGMEEFEARYIKNGMLDYLLEERLDWQYAKEINPRNTDAEYLYGELAKRKIPAIIMEPLLGGRLSNLPNNIMARLKQREPERSVASWAFRYAGSYPDVLVVLSGMTRMEHLQDNLRTYCPLKPLTEDEVHFLHDTATLMMEYDTIPCNDCKYCMPCPYGLDIPAILLHYNKCLNEGNIPTSSQDENYRKARRVYLVGYDRSVPKLRQASHCIGCKQCSPHCPQGIDIPKELHRIDRYVERLKRETL